MFICDIHMRLALIFDFNFKLFLFLSHFIFFLAIYKPFLGSCKVQQKFGPDRFSRFAVFSRYKQIDKQSI